MSALAVAAASWCIDRTTTLTLAHPTVTRVLREAPPIKAALALGSKLRLPRRDHDLLISQIVTRDMDRDGDLDATATTPTGDVLVWHNVGSNRLVRVAPETRPTADRSGIRPSGELTVPGWMVDDRRAWALGSSHPTAIVPPALGFVAPGPVPSRASADLTARVDRGPPPHTSSL